MKTLIYIYVYRYQYKSKHKHKHKYVNIYIYISIRFNSLLLYIRLFKQFLFLEVTRQYHFYMSNWVSIGNGTKILAPHSNGHGATLMAPSDVCYATSFK